MSVPSEQIIETAEIVAVYYRALCDRGIPSEKAVLLACSYQSSILDLSMRMQKPREPWEPPGS